MLIGIIHFPFVSSHYKGKVCRRRRRGRCKQVAKRETKVKRASIPCFGVEDESIRSFLVGQFADQTDTQDHDQQTNSYYH